jgi:DNA-binding beta-propeller fold protein YncE
VIRILVTSASGANGDGYGSVLSFDSRGQPNGPFSNDSRITDPRGMSLDPSGALLYVNGSDDRVLSLDHRGQVVHDSGRIPGLEPGGGTFGPDGRYYITVRRRRTILALPAALDGEGVPLLPDGIVPFPRGFGFGPDGAVYLASGIGPGGEGDNTILVFDQKRSAREARVITDPELSPLDLTVAPNGNVVVTSEHPFGAPDAAASVREYDPATGRLLRVLTPDPRVGFRRPRGLRFGPGDQLYCVGKDHVVAFDFVTGSFVGPVVHLDRLHGQAVVVVDSEEAGDATR